MFWHWLRCYNVNNNSSRDKTFYVVKNMFTVGVTTMERIINVYFY